MSIAQVEQLFSVEEGFFAFRTVRHMVFVDFKSIPAASAAMRKYQNHFFTDPKTNAPITNPNGTGSGMLIDYDKDPTSKRNANYNRQAMKEFKDDALIVRVMCSTCGSVVIKLRLPPPITFATLPVRKTDHSIVIDTEQYVCGLSVARGEIKKLKRTAGIETQYRFNCKECVTLPVAYSSVPFEQTTKLMYLMADAYTTDLNRVRRTTDGWDGLSFATSLSLSLPPSLTRGVLW